MAGAVGQTREKLGSAGYVMAVVGDTGNVFVTGGGAKSCNTNWKGTNTGVVRDVSVGDTSGSATT